MQKQKRKGISVKAEPLVDEAAIIVTNKLKTLVIADLHLGIEEELKQKGINIDSQTENLLERAIKCVRVAKPDATVLLGDIKHNVPKMSFKERKEVPFFFSKLVEYSPIYIVKGNHDGHLSRLLPLPNETKNEIYVRSAKGFLLDNIGYTHGHSFPQEELFSASYILIGHTHPMIRLESSYHITMKPVWIRAKCDCAALKKDYKKIGCCSWNAPLVIIMPAFNEICGGIPLNSNKKLLGPIASKFLRLKNAEVYLLDGSYMGKIGDIRKSKRA